MKIAHSRSKNFARDKQVDITDYQPLKWQYIIRPLDKIQSIVNIAKECCNNNHILYSQCTNSADPAYRLGLNNMLKKCKPSEIIKDVFCDCSSFIQAIMTCVGYNLGYLTTSTMRDEFKNHPQFIVKQFDYNDIKLGDILLMEGTHTAIVVEVDKKIDIKDVKKYKTKIVRAEPYLRMRVSPSMNADIVLKIPDKAEVEILMTQGAWDYVYYNSHKGWCNNYYLR